MSGLVGGVQSALVGVSDPEPHLRLWEALGWSVVSRQRRDARLYGQAGQARVTELSPPGASTGRVELLQFEARPQAAERPHALASGLFAIDVYVNDMEAAGAACAAAGFRWGAGGPQDYEFANPAGGTVIVREGLIEGPDGLNLVLVRAGRPRATQVWAADPSAPATELSSVVLSSFDMDASVSFWGPDGMGLDLMYDVELAQDALSRMLSVAPGTRFRLAFLGGGETARVEVMSPAGAALEQPESGSALASIGLVAWAVSVSGFELATGRIRAAGAELLHQAEGRATFTMPGGGVLEVRASAQ